MKIKKLENYSKNGFIAYYISMMYPEIIENELTKDDETGIEWLKLDVMDSEDGSLFPIRVMRMESNDFVLLTTQDYELDLAFQIGQMFVADVDMDAEKTFKELLEKIKSSSDDLESELKDIKVKSEHTAVNIEELVRNLKGAVTE